VLCVIGIAVFDRAIVYSPAIVLLPLAVAYVLFGLSYDLYARGRRLLRRDADEDSEPSPERVSPPESPSKTPVAK
jgi:hypothetical protein